MHTYIHKYSQTTRHTYIHTYIITLTYMHRYVSKRDEEDMERKEDGEEGADVKRHLGSHMRSYV